MKASQHFSQRRPTILHAHPPPHHPYTTQDCASHLLQLEFKKGAAPPSLLTGGETAYEGCVVCDDALAALCEVRGFAGGGARWERSWELGGWELSLQPRFLFGVQHLYDCPPPPLPQKKCLRSAPQSQILPTKTATGQARQDVGEARGRGAAREGQGQAGAGAERPGGSQNEL